MVGKIIALIVVITTIVIGISVYLAPDDLASCSGPDIDGECGPVDAIIAVSGGDTVARTGEAIRLFQAGWAPTIIFSGAAADKEGPSNAHVMRQLALNQGVPAEAIVIEEDSETTRQNAEQVRQYLEDNSASKVILVTSGYHMRRASLEFSRHVASEVEIVRHPVAKDRQWGPFWWLTPQGWWLALSELVKISAFYLGGTR